MKKAHFFRCRNCGDKSSKAGYCAYCKLRIELEAKQASAGVDEFHT